MLSRPLLLLLASGLTLADVSITTDSYNVNPQQPPQWAIDNNPATFWHTAYTPNNSPLPHHVNIDLGEPTAIQGFTYLPRQDGVKNGNIGQWTLQVSPDKVTFTTIATGSFADDSTLKLISFATIETQHILFTALTEAGNRGPWSSAAEFGWSPGETGVTITADSYNLNPQQPPQYALDDNPNTFWHTAWTPTTPALPHHVNIDIGALTVIDGFSYLPRQDGSLNGNIGQWSLQVSPDKITFTTVASGTFIDDNSIKQIGFAPIQTRHLLFTAFTEAGNRGPWTSAAEFGWSLTQPGGALGQWDPVIPMPLVPAGAFVEYQTGKVLTFSSYKVNNFLGSGLTYTATYDPSTKTVSERTVTQTDHDMFCPGLSLESTGLTIVTGGDDANKLSIFNPVTNTWTVGATMKIPRGYQASTSVSDGRIFVIGGSWNGGEGGKNGEIYSPRLNTWTLLPGCPVQPMLTNDAQGIYRADNHGWLFGWSNGFVFQAGPSRAMNWYGTAGTGSQQSAGVRGNDGDAMNGNAVMYDVMNGKIFTAGGAPSYQNSQATNNVHIITIGAPNTMPTVIQVASMTNARAFANSVVLPNGKIFVTGGENFAVPFSDNTAVLTPELYNPATNTWQILPPHTVPRNYHSVAVLMLDGRIFTGGGGLCGQCETNHEDAQIYNPGYLYTSSGALATRPTITKAPAAVQVGTNFQITTNSPCTSFSLIKFGSATHSVDTDQRRIVFTPISTAGNTYTFAMPGDAGKAMPGYWMFFALNSAGVPSVAATIRVTISPP